MYEVEESESAFGIQERIEAPLIWVAPPYCEILDLQENHHEEVIRLIKHHYFKKDPMCAATYLKKDPESMRQYLDLIQVWIEDSTSLIAISKSSGRVIGTIITRINNSLDKTNTYSRVYVFQGKALDSIMGLKSALVLQADAYIKFGTEKYLRIYLLCVHSSYEKKNLGAELLYASYQLAMTLQLEAVAGIFTSAKSQRIASEVGFEMMTEIRYSNWIVDDEVIFDDPGVGNYSAAFMGKLLPDESGLKEILDSRKQTWNSEEEKKSQRTKNRS